VNITSLIGFLMLIGIVVTNAIVLVDRVQQLREKGHSIRDSLIEAGLTRLRPIIMTAGATILALVPLALGLSKGTLISKGLAVVVIGGLTTSTLLTLLIVPIVYELIYSRKGRMARLSGRKSVANLETFKTEQTVKTIQS
jgi:multidrug efflux pump subunit AcrB